VNHDIIKQKREKKMFLKILKPKIEEKDHEQAEDDNKRAGGAADEPTGEAGPANISDEHRNRTSNLRCAEIESAAAVKNDDSAGNKNGKIPDS